MSTFSKDLLEFKLKFYGNIIRDMTALLSVHAVLFFIEYFSQYLMVRFCVPTEDDPDSVSTGAGPVGISSGVEVLQTIVQLRNAIIHCKPGKISEYCKFFTKIDFDNVDNGHDQLTTVGLHALSSVDWIDLRDFLLLKQ